jgi:hypothetical protein
MTATPNTTFRAVRMGMLLSQDDMARRLREAGAPDASKRLVQRWEAGTTLAPRPAYARALEVVTGLPIESLGFQMPVPGSSAASSPGEMPTAEAQPSARGSYNGVWLSRYEHPSSSRGETFVGQHHVLLLQHGDRLTVRSLPESAQGELTMDLTVDGYVVTGTWVEVTAKDGYYRGARYHGAIQMIAEPTGRRMSGKWVGFDRDMGVSVGPWDLTFQDASTSMKTLAEFNRRPEADS